MSWLTYSLITALAVSIRDISVKRFHEHNPLEIAGMELFWSLPFLLASLFFIDIPELDHVFWVDFAISLPLNGFAYILYLYAIKISPLSLTVPFLAFTPAFMVITGKIILDEDISLWGGSGMLLIIIGSYVLNFTERQADMLQPLRHFLHEKGSWLMLTVSLIFAFAAVIGKEAMLHSSPLFFSFSFFAVFNTMILVILFMTRKVKASALLKYTGRGSWLGLLLIIHVGCHGLAIVISNAAYMIAVKRSSILFTVIMGIILFTEENRKWRGIGTVLMFSGVLLISLKG